MEKHLGHPVSSVPNNLAKVKRSTAVLASLSGLSEPHRGAFRRRTASGRVGPTGSQISWERTVLAQLKGSGAGGCGEKKKSRDSGSQEELCCLSRLFVSHRGSST